MLQRLIAALLGVLGVAAAALGVASATAWRADDPLVAAATVDDARTLVTDPGVLELAGDPVTVTVSAGDDPVVLAIGRDTDVDAWIGTDPYARVTGLSDWHTLATVTGEPPAGTEPTADPTATADAAEPAPSADATEPAPSADATQDATAAATQAADPTGSDLWIVETGGDGTTSLRWTEQPGRWSLIAVSLGDTAPTLELSWPQTVTTPWLWPGVAVGVLLIAVSAVLWVRIWRRSRLGPDADWHDVSTGMIAAVTPAPTAPASTPATTPVARTIGTVSLPPTTSSPDAAAPGAPVTGAVPVAGQPLTRRQIREAEAAAAAEAKRRGRRPATGALPVVVPPATGAVPAVTPPEAERATPVRGIPAVPTTPSAPPALQPSAGAVGPGTPAPSAAAAPVPARAVPPVPAAPAPAAPSGAPTAGLAQGTAEPEAPTAVPARRRGLGSLLGRRGRGSEDASAPATTPETSAPAPSALAAPRAATSWTPIPGRPVSPPTGPAAPGGTTPTGAAGSGPLPPATADEDGAARAQRADAWRRMWGFTAEGEPPAGDTPPSTPDDRSQEDR